MTKPIFKWTAFVMFCLAMATANACADQWTLNLSNGTVITVDADSDQTVPWEPIAASGKSKSEPSRLGDIQRIILTDQPASMKIAKVRLSASQGWNRQTR